MGPEAAAATETITVFTALLEPGWGGGGGKEEAKEQNLQGKKPRGPGSAMGIKV